MELSISKPATALFNAIEAEKRRLSAVYKAQKRYISTDDLNLLAATAVARGRGLSLRQLKRKLDGSARAKRVRKPAPRGRAALVAKQMKGRG